MIKTISLKLLLLAAIAQLAVGQQSKPEIYLDSSGQVYVQANMPAYFFIAPESNESVKTLIPSKDQKTNPMYFDGNGAHYLRVQDAETNKPVTFKILADGIAPKVTLYFKNGLLMNSGKRFYIDVGSKADVIAKDNLSGVRSIYVSVDSSDFTSTNAILFDARNDYLVKSYAIDNVGNISDTLKFRVITSVDSIVKINNIYFDVNSSRLRPESKAELNEFVQVLNQYPEIKIELRAHTDCQGNGAYNLLLSERRADAAVSYLVNMGISKTRLTFKGFGDTRPVNECTKGVTCSDEKHRQNRRVEFKILPIK